MALDFSDKKLDFALRAVREAAQMTRRVRTELAMMGLTKEDLSPVTVADFAVQAIVGRALAETFPGDLFVAEETSSDLQEGEGRAVLDVVTQFVGRVAADAGPADVCGWIDRGAADPGGRFWTLDPVDGTKGFLRDGQYAVALALIEDDTVQLGLLGCPSLGRDCSPDAGDRGVLAAAVRGEGAWLAPLNGTRSAEFNRLKVSDRDDISQARILRSFEAAHTNTGQIDALVRQLGICAEPVRMDSQAKYTVLAAGKGDLLFRLLSPAKPDYRERIWDQAAGAIVVEEAGGRITDLDGQPLDFSRGRLLDNNRGILASNGLLHQAALEALRNL